ncbi:MAG: exodeoxyribonuclease VII large subunit [Burkholderiaceae bacterium]
MAYTDKQASSKGFSAADQAFLDNASGPPEPSGVHPALSGARLWRVGDLCQALAQALDTAFNPVQVRGEISGLSRAASGHCYFSLKDTRGQIRCALFRRTATQLDFSPQEGEQVEVLGELGVYEQRGDLQLVVQSMRRAGQGPLYEQFLLRKARLQALGLFDAARKRTLPDHPRGIGVVTSLGAAALHDVLSALQRRVPHIPVLIAPAAVQGAQAPAELIQALSNLYQYRQDSLRLETDLTLKTAPKRGFQLDVILLVRGGGSLEDLWAFNDEALVHAISQSPVPVISGIGHETDFTLADFASDLRAPTPTAAAELVAPPRETELAALAHGQQRLQVASQRQLERQAQRLDSAAALLGRPSVGMARQQLQLSRLGQQLHYAVRAAHQQRLGQWQAQPPRWAQVVQAAVQAGQQRLERAALRLQALDPRLALQRGYVMLRDAAGQPVTRSAQVQPGQPLRASLVDGELDLTVSSVRQR